MAVGEGLDSSPLGEVEPELCVSVSMVVPNTGTAQRTTRVPAVRSYSVNDSAVRPVPSSATQGPVSSVPDEGYGDGDPSQPSGGRGSSVG